MKATIAISSAVFLVALAWACGRSGTKCLTDQDCAAVNPSVCSNCPAFQNQLVCWAAECVCACEVDGGTALPDGGCLTTSDCPAPGVDTCNICPSPQNHFVCSVGACVCACRVDGG